MSSKQARTFIEASLAAVGAVLLLGLSLGVAGVSAERDEANEKIAALTAQNEKLVKDHKAEVTQLEADLTDATVAVFSCSQQSVAYRNAVIDLSDAMVDYLGVFPYGVPDMDSTNAWINEAKQYDCPGSY